MENRIRKLFNVFFIGTQRVTTYEIIFGVFKIVALTCQALGCILRYFSNSHVSPPFSLLCHYTKSGLAVCVALLPVIVAYSDWWLGHWRRSIENLWIMRKVGFIDLYSLLKGFIPES
jgi:hypothetical protein